VVLQADCNAAENVLARLADAEISLFTKHSIAKEILLERTFEVSNLYPGDTRNHRMRYLKRSSGKDKPQSRERLFTSKEESQSDSEL